MNPSFDPYTPKNDDATKEEPRVEQTPTSTEPPSYTSPNLGNTTAPSAEQPSYASPNLGNPPPASPERPSYASPNPGNPTPPPPRPAYANSYTPPYTPYTPYNPYAYHAPHPAPQPPKKKEHKGASKGFVITFVCLGMVLSMLAGVALSALLWQSDEKGSSTLTATGGNDVIIKYESAGETPVITDKGDTAYVASLVADTVVEVTTETVVTDAYYGQYVTQGAGSGVIISSDAGGSYIITCAHVIDGAGKVTVKLRDGTEYQAVELASDSQTDIGIIKLNVTGLPCATIGDFSTVVVGEEVIAIGNPLGELGGSVTNGIISALDRDIIIDGTTYHLLQTNAEINPGNSGGGLFDAEGHLIGIVNAKSAAEGIEGLGFAIPIDDAISIATNLIENGYVAGRVQIGIEVISVQTQEDVQMYWQYSRYFTDYGIYIMRANDSRFEEGDLLVAIDSVKVTTIGELTELLLEYEVGDTVVVTVSRINDRNRVEMVDIDIVLTEKTS